MEKALIVLLMVFCGAGAGARGQSTSSPWPFSRQPWNVKGDVLILDVGSLRYQGNHPMFPVFDENGCADACARTPGCDAWTYCGRKEGCGSGCATYVAKNPQLRTTIGPNINPTQPNPAWNSLAAITGFGPWGVTANCQYVDGSPGDAWPYGMCSLKKQQNPDKPEFWSTNAGEGWVSGFTKQPPQCAAAGLPVRTCTRCIRSADPASCLRCASSNPAWQLGMLASAQMSSGSLTMADGCSSCYDSAAPAKCVECLSSGAACGECALQQPPSQPSQAGAAATKVDVAACIDCTQRLGSNFTAACVECSYLGAAPQQVQQCMGCLGEMQPLACSNTDYNAPCWNPVRQPGSCAHCVSRAANFGTCVDCIKSTPHSANCYSCASFGDPAKQATCYNCSKAAAHPGSGCYDCLNFLTEPSQVQQCLGCLANPKIGAEGKGSCFGCQNWCDTFEARAQCVTCLGTQQDNYSSACACRS